MNLLHAPLAGRFVRLEPLATRHRDEMRAALDGDEAAWSIMVSVGFGAHFDRWWTEAMAGPGLVYAVVRQADGRVVGTSGYFEVSARHKRVEIGGTYYCPEARGGPVNPEAKRLLMHHAFERGAGRVEFVTDAINVRSRAALAKLGALEEGVLRHHKTTWTGRVRDTVMFSVLAGEWPTVRARLIPFQPIRL